MTNLDEYGSVVLFEEMRGIWANWQRSDGES